MKEFEYYLDAVKYCTENNISISLLVKRDLRTWVVPLKAKRVRH